MFETTSPLYIDDVTTPSETITCPNCRHQNDNDIPVLEIRWTLWGTATVDELRVNEDDSHSIIPNYQRKLSDLVGPGMLWCKNCDSSFPIPDGWTIEWA